MAERTLRRMSVTSVAAAVLAVTTPPTEARADFETFANTPTRSTGPALEFATGFWTYEGPRYSAPYATAWAALVAMGEDGYLNATDAILETGARIRNGIDKIDGLHVLGDPLWVIAFAFDDVDIYEVMARMSERGWSLNGLHHPPAVHIAVTLRHTQPGVAERFLADLSETVEEARAAGGGAATGAAPMYGMAATFPARGAVNELMTRYIDRIYEIEED